MLFLWANSVKALKEYLATTLQNDNYLCIHSTVSLQDNLGKLLPEWQTVLDFMHQ